MWMGGETDTGYMGSQHYMYTPPVFKDPGDKVWLSKTMCKALGLLH